ncbi:probable transcription factor PosF21 [Daucus carota subsp. sativus]|nr:PREDICTED: probable transcription factor PosF21 [Daucus carota subsp. sativus]XP_017219999.1 PREDICTED: probable transcription factor PosF21 [Daucus carota subsp. sativus]
MDKDKSLNLGGGGGLPPPSGRFSPLPPSGNAIHVKTEALGSTALPPLPPDSLSESGRFGHGMSSDVNQFSYDISQMPDNPPKTVGHRRAHSEILTLPDDLSFDSDLGVVGGMDGPSYSDDTEEDLFSMYLDMDKFNTSSATSSFQVGEHSNASVQPSNNAPVSGSAAPATENIVSASTERPRVRHQHSQSMDGSTTIKPELLMSGTEDTSSVEAKKSMSAAKLAELALVDPKRAKRIWANRQSAARSKERKMRYIAELERKVQAMQTEATTLAAQLTLLQRDTNGLTAENSELKLRLQTTEQQVHLQDALNDALKEEIQHLKLLTGQNIVNGSPMMNYPSSYGVNQQFYPNNQNMQSMLTAHQFQQLKLHSQKQQNQFQQQQVHQFQQQQLQLQQQQPSLLQQQQQPSLLQQHREQHASQGGDTKMKGSTSSTNLGESSPDINMHMSKD